MKAEMSAENKYIPALRFHWLTPFYDRLAKPFGTDFRRLLLRHANIQPGQQVLDLGCGTGIMTIALRQSVPGAQVTGLDADEQALKIARGEAERAGANIQWDHALAFDLPYPDNAFDVVMSSFMIHHLTAADKLRAFREVHRVRRPHGSLYVLDFGPPFSPVSRIQAAVMKHLEQTADNFNGRLLPMLAEAGFGRRSEGHEESPREAGHGNTVFGPIAIYVADKSGG